MGRRGGSSREIVRAVVHVLGHRNQLARLVVIAFVVVNVVIVVS